MRRIISAFAEWLELRARPRNERRFHIDRAAADFRALGLSRRAAQRLARSRFGPRRHLRLALREIGGDSRGLVELLRAHRVLACAWLQPAVLFASIAIILLLSPAPLVILGSILDQPLTARARQTVFLSVQAPWPYSPAISAGEFEALRRIPALLDLSRYRTIYARADVAPGATPASVESVARVVTGNPHVVAITQFEELERIQMGPALVVWALLAICAFCTLRSHLPAHGKGRWLLYALSIGFLHLLASLAAFAFANQLWNPLGPACALLFLAYLLVSAMQCLYWRLDMRQRCPVCLERLLLASTTGAAESMLISAAVTESICAHGHGALVETRWNRHFSSASSELRHIAPILF